MYLDPYEDYPEDDDRETDNHEVSIEIATKLKALGNTKFKNGELEAALEKWQSKPSFYFIFKTLVTKHHLLTYNLFILFFILL